VELQKTSKHSCKGAGTGEKKKEGDKKKKDGRAGHRRSNSNNNEEREYRFGEVTSHKHCGVGDHHGGKKARKQGALLAALRETIAQRETNEPVRGKDTHVKKGWGLEGEKDTKKGQQGEKHARGR